jgi:ketosteroid isomerase-like protein
VDREQVQAWVDAYVAWWRASDVTGVAELFSPDIHYLKSPYSEPAVGHEAVSAFWRDDLGQTFEVVSAVVAVDGRNAVVRLQVTYVHPERQEYRDLWVMQFADDGRVELFEEWVVSSSSRPRTS